MTTLLELTGALGITSILGLTAITSMSGAPGQADDVRARASLHAAVVAALTADIDDASDDVSLTEEMKAAEPGLGWTALASDDANVISVVGIPATIGLATRSLSGSCFLARVGVGVGVEGTVELDETPDNDHCSGGAALSSP